MAGQLRAAVELLTIELAKIATLPPLVHSPWSQDEEAQPGMFIMDMSGQDETGTIRKTTITDARATVRIRANYSPADLPVGEHDVMLKLMDIVDQVRDQILSAALTGTFVASPPTFTCALVTYAMGVIPELDIATIMLEFLLEDFR